MDHEDVPAAAQISQADIIERQAESIARLKRQVLKGSQYKQLTKSKLKEAAARLKEYRLRVETLLQEAEPLKKRLKEEQKEHEKTKKLYKSTLNRALKANKQVRTAATQTKEMETKRTVTRTSQTTLSGEVVNRRTMVDSAVQTKETQVDTLLPSRKRGRELGGVSDADQLVPRLSRQIGLQQVDATSQESKEVWPRHEPLQMPDLEGEDSAFLHETSAALDAELAFSDSDDESGGSGDTMEVDSGQEAAGVAVAVVNAPGGVDSMVLDEIDKELQTSSDEEDDRVTGLDRKQTGGQSSVRLDGTAAARKAAGNGHGGGAASLLGGIDPAVFNDIDKDLETSSEEEDDNRGTEKQAGGAGSGVNERQASGAGSSLEDRRNVTNAPRAGVGIGHAAHGSTTERLRVVELDSVVSNAIDKDLESSSDDEEDEHSADMKFNVTTKTQAGSAKAAGVVVPQSKRTLLSIDDELDDEFAALDSDSEPEKKPASGSKDGEDSSSSSGSSDSDSSDSSDSDLDEEVDPTTGDVDKTELTLTVNGAGVKTDKNLPESSSLSAAPTSDSMQNVDQLSSVPVEVEEVSGTTAQQQTDGDEQGALPSLTITGPVKTNSVVAVEEAYSPIVKAGLQPLASIPPQLDASAATANGSKDNEESRSIVSSPKSDVQKQVPATNPPTKNAVENVFVAEAAIADDTKSSSSSVSYPTISLSNEPPLETVSSKAHKPTVAKVDVSDNNEQKLALLPADSAPPTAGPGELEHADEADPAVLLEQIADISSPTDDSAIGRPRKADEANLDDTQAPSEKKMKLDEDGVGVEVTVVSAAADNKTAKTKAAPKLETKEERRIKKALATFKQAIILGKGEEADKEYARRTITVLVNQSSKFIDAHLSHVTTLCQVLAGAYRKLDISPMLVVRGALGVFRTPRSRRLMQENKMGLSWLCNQVLIRLMFSGDRALQQDGSVAPGSLSLSLVHECLLHLRALLVEERSNIGDCLSKSKLQVALSTQQIIVSHDKVFLAHICALHTHLCQSTGQLARSRVLLFDILRHNPNIRGLYFAMTMLEIYPAILEREFDQHCMERQLLLKETLQQVLIVISGVAAANEELLLHQSSITMLHRIADALQMPELEEIDGSDPSFSRTCAEKLLTRFAAICQASNTGDEDEKSLSAEFFELAKSLEVCTAVFGLDLVTQLVTIERCQELFSNASVEAKGGVISVVGHIAMAIAPKTIATQSCMTRSEQYVESVIDWLHRLLSTETTDDKTTSEDRFKLRLKCATVCVELILEYSIAAGLNTRRQVLCAVVNWFDAMSSDQLIGLPATFLRRLRLAVVAARPQVVPMST